MAVFHLLLQNELKDCSDFAISRKLKITEAKVKQLRYEVNLVIEKNDSDYREELMQLMSIASYKFADGGKKITAKKFAIPPQSCSTPPGRVDVAKIHSMPPQSCPMPPESSRLIPEFCNATQNPYYSSAAQANHPN